MYISWQDIVIQRLMTGHARLTYEFLLTKCALPTYTKCHFALTIISHLFHECLLLTNLAPSTWKHYSKQHASLYDSLISVH